MFKTNDSEETKLTKRAREEYDKLQAKLAELVTRDREREPKLTDDEKAEIAGLKSRLAFLKPIIPKLQKLLETKEERLKHIERYGVPEVINGGDLDALVSEYILLSPAIRLLATALHDIMLEDSQANNRIEKIKESARMRELREEAHNG